MARIKITQPPEATVTIEGALKRRGHNHLLLFVALSEKKTKVVVLFVKSLTGWRRSRFQRLVVWLPRAGLEGHWAVVGRVGSDDASRVGHLVACHVDLADLPQAGAQKNTDPVSYTVTPHLTSPPISSAEEITNECS